MSHGIHKCRSCREIVMQCRCMNHNQEYFDMKCEACKKKEWPELKETPTDKSPREFWYYNYGLNDSEPDLAYRGDCIHLIEHRAYLAVKEKCAQLDDHNNRLIDESCKIIKERDKLQQELEATKYDHNQMRGVLDNMKQELEASRELFTQAHALLKSRDAQIKDYESALSETWPGEFGAVVNAHHKEALNKWRAK